MGPFTLDIRTGRVPARRSVASSSAPMAEREPETSFELIRRAQAGDADAVDELCRRYGPRLTRWARGRLPRGARPAMETGDLVQDVLSRAVQSLRTFEPRHEGSFHGFVRRILTNRLHDFGRIDRRRPPPDPLDSGTDIAAGDPTPFDDLSDREMQARFDTAFARLSQEDQDLIFLRLELGYGYQDIADMLGRNTPDAVRVAARRAILRLAREMSRDHRKP